MTRPYRVVQWATGAVGKTCLRAVLDDPAFQLVGLYVYGAAKEGKDAGEIARREPSGVLATRDIEEIIAMPADVVLHTPRLQIPYQRHDGDVCRLLRAGKNVITTAGNHLPSAHGPERLAMFTEAAVDGGSTLFGVGISPGVIGERLAMSMTGASLRVDAIHIEEVLDARRMPDPDFVFTVMGMGQPISSIDLVGGELAVLYGQLYRETLVSMADQLGVRSFHIEADHRLVPATHDLQVSAGAITAGTVGTTEWRWHLLADDRRLVTLAIIWTMQPDLPAYAGAAHWTVRVTGQPEMTMRIDLVEPSDPTRRTTAAQFVTAGPVINAIPTVVGAPPGVLEPHTFLPYQLR